MYQIKHQYNHGTWIEKRATSWLKEEEVNDQIDYLASKGAIKIRVVQLVDVTEKFKIASKPAGEK